MCETATFDENCLAEVIEFITERTKEHRATLPKREISREARMKIYQRNRLTKEQNSGRLENVNTVIQPENGLVEGSQSSGETRLTPLEVDLGVLEIK